MEIKTPRYSRQAKVNLTELQYSTLMGLAGNRSISRTIREIILMYLAKSGDISCKILPTKLDLILGDTKVKSFNLELKDESTN